MLRKDRSKLSLPNTSAHWAKCQVQELGRTGPMQPRWREKPRPEPSHHTKVCRILNDTQTNVLPGYPESAICVQRFDDSLNSAIHTTYRNWLRSSSMHEPRDPPLEVVTFKIWLCLKSITYMRLQVRKKTWKMHKWGRSRSFKTLRVTPLAWYYSQWCCQRQTVMILPQVHLRKPCYDFYFL